MASSFQVAVVLVACVCRAAAQEVSLTVQISDDVERTLFVNEALLRSVATSLRQKT